MKIKQVRSYYENKKNAPCPLTDKLIMAGYQQESKGKDSYISFAKEQGVEIDYRKGEPNQWWHLMTHCDHKNEDDPFDKRVQCGELIFWMAEVANCVDTSKMEKLVDEIIESGTPVNISNEVEPKVNYKRNWNRKIQELCFENIFKAVEES